MDCLLFREGDVKPPELRLTSTPYWDKSYDNATLTWTFNEYATSTCVIKTSLTTEFAPCNNNWSGTFLPEGNINIEIDARDKSRNSAPTYKYTWYNSKSNFHISVDTYSLASKSSGVSVDICKELNIQIC